MFIYDISVFLKTKSSKYSYMTFIWKSKPDITLEKHFLKPTYIHAQITSKIRRKHLAF